ncbi:MAG TPA: hypothetical protein VEG40_00235 [Gaiellaceae bacterium]|nr:hypothetical protein [Gaiellaceae bacterium]
MFFEELGQAFSGRPLAPAARKRENRTGAHVPGVSAATTAVIANAVVVTFVIIGLEPDERELAVDDRRDGEQGCDEAEHWRARFI